MIVDAAESSPAAAREAANRIRKFLTKDNFPRAYVQYNAIMLVRILTDNPGKSFSRNLDAKFVTTIKELLRDGRDMSVQQILRETLENFETQKPDDETLAPLRVMWKKEKLKMGRGGNVVSGVDHIRLTFSISKTATAATAATHARYPKRTRLQSQPAEVLCAQSQTPWLAPAG